MFDDFEIRELGFSDDGEDIMTREKSAKLISLVQEGVLDAESVLQNLIDWLSERDVANFFEDEYSEFDEEDEENNHYSYTDSSIDGVYIEPHRNYCLECGDDYEVFSHTCENNENDLQTLGCKIHDDKCEFCDKD